MIYFWKNRENCEKRENCNPDKNFWFSQNREQSDDEKSCNY